MPRCETDVHYQFQASVIQDPARMN